MSDFYNPTAGGALGEIFTADASRVSAEGVTLLLPGQEKPTAKAYRSLGDASISAGDRVICARLSGTIVVLGRVGLASDAGEGAVFIPAGSTGLTTADGRQFVSRRTD